MHNIPPHLYEHIALACEMRANYIETGSVHSAAVDAAREAAATGGADARKRLSKSLNLSGSQTTLVKELREAAASFRVKLDPVTTEERPPCPRCGGGEAYLARVIQPKF